jgi:hypothetical protein
VRHTRPVWAVDDATASTFAATFYDEMLRGRRFLDAVAGAGKQHTHWAATPGRPTSVTAIPTWVFERRGADAQSPYRPLSESYRGIGSSVGLENALETLRVESKYQGKDKRGTARAIALSRRPVWFRWGGNRQRRDGISPKRGIALGERATAIGW